MEKNLLLMMKILRVSFPYIFQIYHTAMLATAIALYVTSLVLI